MNLRSWKTHTSVLFLQGSVVATEGESGPDWGHLYQVLPIVQIKRYFSFIIVSPFSLCHLTLYLTAQLRLQCYRQKPIQTSISRGSAALDGTSHPTTVAPCSAIMPSMVSESSYPTPHIKTQLLSQSTED